MFVANNKKRYDVGEHEKSFEGKRDKAEFSLCFVSVLSRNTSDTVLFLLEITSLQS